MTDFLLQVRAGRGVMLTFVHFQETQKCSYTIVCMWWTFLWSSHPKFVESRSETVPDGYTKNESLLKFIRLCKCRHSWSECKRRVRQRYQVHKQIQKAAEVKNAGDSASVTKPGREQAKIKLVIRGDNPAKNTSVCTQGRQRWAAGAGFKYTGATRHRWNKSGNQKTRGAKPTFDRTEPKSKTGKYI